METYLKDICQAAKEAGEIMRSVGNQDLGISEKSSDVDLVTEYDKKIQKFLIERLSTILPEARFMGEENGQNNFKEEYKKGLLFIIDPIDGTSNFICGYGPSVTSIGLFKDGKPYIGVIYNPWMDQLFYAQRGCGAWMNGEEIHTSTKPMRRSLVIFGTAAYYEDHIVRSSFENALAYMKHCIDIRRSGSAAWDLCQVACGAAGLYTEPRIQIWDYAAGALILMEAGGILTDLEGKELSFTGPSSVVAASEGVTKDKYLPKDMGTFPKG